MAFSNSERRQAVVAGAGLLLVTLGALVGGFYLETGLLSEFDAGTLDITDIGTLASIVGIPVLFGITPFAAESSKTAFRDAYHGDWSWSLPK